MVLHVGPAQDPGKCKVRCVVHPQRAPLQSASKLLLAAMIDTIASVAEVNVTVDRGHAKSDGACSEACFWISSPPTQLHEPSPPPESDGGNDDDSDDKRDDLAHDPWENGADPWSNGTSGNKKHNSRSHGSGREPFHKKMRTRCSCESKVDDIAARVDRLEQLLLIANMDSFATLDRNIALLREKPWPGTQPDQEPSPEKPGSVHKKTCPMTPGCIVFDLTANDGENTVEEDVLSSARPSRDHHAEVHTLRSKVFAAELCHAASHVRWVRLVRKYWANTRTMNIPYVMLHKMSNKIEQTAADSSL